ncbi:hypothetical protein Q2941_26095, partial [Bradyrhizobium sp. UFLA05-153]
PNLITITGIRDHHRLEHLITIPGMRRQRDKSANYRFLASRKGRELLRVVGVWLHRTYAGEAFDKWRDKQRPIPNVSDAIRELIEIGLKAGVKD